MIKFKKVSKKFGLTEVVDEISFEIEQGECVAITGSSGAGKSTLLHMIIGAEQPTEGTIEVNGLKLQELSSNQLQMFRRNIGFIFQDFKLIERKTVFENVAFVMESYGESDEEVHRKVHQVIQKVGMKDKEKRFPSELSGGEKQRVAIARAIVHDAQIIIADEPTGNLDWHNAVEVIKLLKKLNSEGITVIIATHDDQVLELLNPRIIELEDTEYDDTLDADLDSFDKDIIHLDQETENIGRHTLLDVDQSTAKSHQINLQKKNEK